MYKPLSAPIYKATWARCMMSCTSEFSLSVLSGVIKPFSQSRRSIVTLSVFQRELEEACAWGSMFSDFGLNLLCSAGQTWSTGSHLSSDGSRTSCSALCVCCLSSLFVFGATLTLLWPSPARKTEFPSLWCFYLTQRLTCPMKDECI